MSTAKAGSVGPAPRTACTLKQARADFKARGGPVISEHEQKQIDRAAQLDRRAWKAREAEKRRADADKRRLESERQNKIRAQELLGSQRTTDRFGYKSSQFHLGAFFTGAVPKAVSHQDAMADEDAFGDEDLDDQSLLDALDAPAHASTTSDSDDRDACRIVEDKSEAESLDELVLLWEDFDSNSQIARDLAVPPESQLPVVDDQHIPSSFEASLFDISIEDLEALERSTSARIGDAADEVRCMSAKELADRDRRMMPPPQLPQHQSRSNPITVESRRRDSGLSEASSATTNVPGDADRRAVKSPDRISVAPNVCGFSIDELETFVDDDLELTQVAPT